MQTSEQINELATALAVAQGQMGSAIKGSDNSYLRSKYADLSSVISVLKKPLADNGISYVQFPFSREGFVGVTTRLMHSSGQWMEGDFSIPAAKNDAHTYGTIVTYCRRFSLQSIVGIPAEDDDGNAATQAAKTLIDAEQVALIKALISETNTNESKFLKAYNVPAIDQMTTEQFDNALPLLESKKSAS